MKQVIQIIESHSAEMCKVYKDLKKRRQAKADFSKTEQAIRLALWMGCTSLGGERTKEVVQERVAEDFVRLTNPGMSKKWVLFNQFTETPEARLTR